MKGRGTPIRPPGRFDQYQYEADPEYLEWQHQESEDERPSTQVLEDASRSVITRNNSPDIGFETSLNPYRGCEHGCAYCYARPSHEYLGMSAGLDFETRIVAKRNAPDLLRAELMRPSWKPQLLMMSGITDCYQPLEKKLKLTRGCLEVLEEFGNPVHVITKNALVMRDADILSRLARKGAASVCLSVTTLQDELAGVLEPRAARPARRLEAIRRLSEAGVPTGVMVAPVIPAINDHEIPAVLDAAARAGASFAGVVPLRLPLGVADIFVDWLERRFPDRKEKVLSRLRSIRGGKLNQSQFHQRFAGEGPFADQMRRLFELGCRRAGLTTSHPPLSTESFRRPGPEQLQLW